MECKHGQIIVCGKFQVGKSLLLKRICNIDTDIGWPVNQNLRSCMVYEREYSDIDTNISIIDTPGFGQWYSSSTTTTPTSSSIADTIIKNIKFEHPMILLWVTRFNIRPTKDDIDGLEIILSKLGTNITSIGIISTFCTDGIPQSYFTTDYKIYIKTLSSIKNVIDRIDQQVLIEEEYSKIWKKYCIDYEDVWNSLLPARKLHFSYFDVDEHLSLRSNNNNDVLLPDSTKRLSSIVNMVRDLSKDPIFCFLSYIELKPNN